MYGKRSDPLGGTCEKIPKYLWNDWRWQIQNRITAAEEIEKFIALDEHEKAALACDTAFSLTPHYARLLTGEGEALRRLVIPTDFEHVHGCGEEADSLHEEKYRPVPGIFHRYPHKALLMATSFCASKCRYCTRSRLVSEDIRSVTSDTALDEALAYLRRTPAIRDVLISGGDPLTLSDEKIDRLLGELSEIKHIEFMRIGTKTPAVLPQRFTPALIKILKKYRPLFLSLHFIHPAELSPETLCVCNKLADAGIPLGSQTVLLKGVNDDAEVLHRLFTQLIKNRVKPYYLYQCDPIPGSTHFRTPIETGLNIMRSLLGRTTGYAIPQFVVDTGGGKIPLLPNYAVGNDAGFIDLQGFDGTVTHYPRITV